MLLAISGGSDSLALLLSFDAWRRIHAPHLSLFAVTVDHALRPEAADEAERVAQICAEHRIPHKTLRWEEAAKGSALSQRAREARYALLARAAEQAGTDLVLTGHTQDDQIETHLMRKARSATGYGLSGMAAATLYRRRLWIVRPLLTHSRQALRDYLCSMNQAWLDDPSNDDEAYERVRVRRAVAKMDAAARADICSAIAKAQAFRARLVDDTVSLIRTNASPVEPSGFRLVMTSEEACIHALRVLLAIAGGGSFLPDEGRVRILTHRAVNGERVTETLSRCVVQAKDGCVTMKRERRDLPQIALEQGSVLWDGRFEITTQVSELLWVAAGDDCMPKVVTGAGGAGDTALERVQIRPVASPFKDRLSGLDWPLANAVAQLLGADAPPALPYSGHDNGIVLT
ncbi:tRNA lysidine(34) synthetase TilS [Limoniibacter endophyticus]|uniref:tRNA lysidine(34) synthetase TilS n=1 Tax=Limoniibacter endophyticus TaxID=1565040 RepID=UPI001679346A|nr:tRNA lysidine(34) synthetase TilS [Limoniibacter endophyticus]